MTTPADIETLVEQIAEQVAQKLADRISDTADDRRWLPLKQAAAYAGMGVKRIKQLARDPDTEIIGYPDPDSGRGDWIFDRHSIDTYRLRPVKKHQNMEQDIINNLKKLEL